MKSFTAEYSCGTQRTFEEDDIVTLKRKNGKRLKGCAIEHVFDDGFVYSRDSKNGGYYSEVRFKEIEDIQPEGEHMELTVTYGCGTVKRYMRGDLVRLKMKSGKQLYACKIENIFEGGFLYSRGGIYSHAFTKDLEDIQPDGFELGGDIQ